MIPFNDLKPLQASLAAELEATVRRVLASGWYILGPELEAFESAFAEYVGARHAVGVANGTDAVELALRALDVGPGDEVITVAHTAVATVCAIERTGATAVLVDIDEGSFTIDPAAVEAAITARTRAIVPVHLYGNPADVRSLTAIAARHGVALVEDCAQAHGARWDGRRVGTFGTLAAFSFYPTKNLGGYGDAGAVVTDDARLAQRLRGLRNYGQTMRYHHDGPGQNSRLDEMQAALLRLKLGLLDGHNARRREIAALYGRCLQGVRLPTSRPATEHVFHLYVVRHEARDGLQRGLDSEGIGTLIHYPIPVHLQPAFGHLDMPIGSLPVTERVAGEILSLPLYIGLSDAAVERVADVVDQIAGGSRGVGAG